MFSSVKEAYIGYIFCTQLNLPDFTSEINDMMHERHRQHLQIIGFLLFAEAQMSIKITSVFSMDTQSECHCRQ